MIYAAWVYPGRVGFENELEAFLQDEEVVIEVDLPYEPGELLGTRVVFEGNGTRYIKTAQAVLDGDKLALFVREAGSDEEERFDAAMREAEIVFLEGSRVVNVARLPGRGRRFSDRGR